MIKSSNFINEHLALKIIVIYKISSFKNCQNKKFHQNNCILLKNSILFFLFKEKNPSEFICTVCFKCTEPSLRNYLAQHLIIINGFEEKHFEALELINWIEEHEKNHK